MDTSGAKDSKENRRRFEDNEQTKNSSEPLDDHKWLENSLCTEVSRGILSSDPSSSIDMTQDKESLPTNRVHTVAESELPLTEVISCDVISSTDVTQDKEALTADRVHTMAQKELPSATEIIVLQNKPKKSMSSPVAPEDYMCTQDDLQVIKATKSIPALPGKEHVIQIDDITVTRKHIECLFKIDDFLHDQVVNAYIALLNDQRHLKWRSDGAAMMENTFVSEILIRDDRLGHQHFNKEYEQKRFWEKRVLSYLQHEMVFIPLNIKDTHWYLAVINAKKCQVQVLDSIGDIFGRGNMEEMLNGLQRYIDHVSPRIDLEDKEIKWTDLQVASWERKEIETCWGTQEDGNSCGLFMLNYIEYWSGDVLSDDVKQVDMTNFRLKLAAILLSSELNKWKGCTWVPNNDQQPGSLSDVEIVDDTTNHTNTTSNKRKRQQSPQSPDQKPDDLSLLLGIPTVDMPRTKEDLIDVICDYIISITDDTTSNTFWVRSFTPYQIDVSVKDLQGLIRMGMNMSEKCFNLGVRVHANNEANRLKNKGINIVTNHYMDLKFCIFLPWSPMLLDTYMLYVLDQENKSMSILDTTPPPKSMKDDIPFKRYVKTILLIEQSFMAGMIAQGSGWHGKSLFHWKTIIPEDIQVDKDISLSGFHALQLMAV